MLRRHLAPVSDAAWEAIDEQVRRSLRSTLAGRHVVDVEGPHGPEHGGRNLGRLRTFDAGDRGVTAGLRLVQSLVEVRTPFVLAQMEVDSIDRGADPDLDPAADAARATALCEDRAIFHGWRDAGIEGIADASSHEAVKIPREPGALPDAATAAMTRLLGAGVEGPYTLLLGTRTYQTTAGATVEGYPVLNLLERQILGGDVRHAPGVEGGILLSRRGGDFLLTLGQEFSVGYAHHDRDEVELYVTESFTFTVHEGEAAVVLR